MKATTTTAATLMGRTYPTQYEERVSDSVRRHAEDLMTGWRDEGRDDERIEDIVRAVVLYAYTQGARDMLDRARTALP